MSGRSVAGGELEFTCSAGWDGERGGSPPCFAGCKYSTANWSFWLAADAEHLPDVPSFFIFTLTGSRPWFQEAAAAH
jgi:hypothetical protein